MQPKMLQLKRFALFVLIFMILSVIIGVPIIIFINIPLVISGVVALILISVVVALLIATFVFGREFIIYCQKTVKIWQMLTNEQKQQQVSNFIGGFMTMLIGMMMTTGATYFFGEGALWPSFMISVLSVPLLSEIMEFEYFRNTSFSLGGVTCLSLLITCLIYIETRC